MPDIAQTPDRDPRAAAPSAGMYGGLSAAQRKARRREQLLDACLDSLHEDGWQATSVRGICARAGLNARYFYESFSGLDELIVAVFDLIVEDATARVTTAMAEASPTLHDQFEAIVRGFTTATTDDPRRAHVAFLEALGSEALMRRRLDAIHAVARVVAGVAVTFHPELEPRDVAVNAQMLAGGLVQTIIGQLEGHVDIDRPTLVERCTTLMVAGITAGLD